MQCTSQLSQNRTMLHVLQHDVGEVWWQQLVQFVHHNRWSSTAQLSNLSQTITGNINSIDIKSLDKYTHSLDRKQGTTVPASSTTVLTSADPELFAVDEGNVIEDLLSASCCCSVLVLLATFMAERRREKQRLQRIGEL